MQEQSSGPISGEMTIQEQVVAKIVGGAAKSIEGVHAMGTGKFGEAVSGVAGRVTGSDPVTRGVRVEVGRKEFAVDLWLTIEFGFNIPKVVDDTRREIGKLVNDMTGLVAKEINVEVVDIHLPGEETERRVE